MAQMQTTVNPYPGGSESLASSVQGELERIRFQLSAIVGKSWWYQPVDIPLASGVAKHWGATYTSFYQIADPTAPVGDNIVLYAKDDGAGNKVLAYRQPTGTVNVLTGPSTAWGSAMTVNLFMQPNPGTPNTKIDVTADRLSAGGYIAVAFSVSIDCTATGANALDSGALGASTFYYVWIIYNPTSATFAGLMSTSGTAPTMPAGYTVKRILGGFRTDGASHFIPGIQTDSTFIYTTPQKVVSATTVAVATSLDLSTYSPANTKGYLMTTVLGNSTYLLMHWASFAVALGNTPVFVGDSTGALGVILNYQFFLPARNSPRTTVYYATGNTNGATDIYLSGWEIQWKE